ncbi:hypothetical protein GCM10009123_10260 [Kangiella japonica]|uniref:Type II secretion system protein GspB C-terminal domain-containing protein n=1 Tax=Kangiella japonica TaxID=647384 RepID=A0ABN0SXK2_9GAMM
MSYILDALKKNKPDNDKEQVPDLSSDHGAEHDYHNFDEENSLKRWLWPSVVMILLLVVAILSFMLLNPSADEAYQQLIQRQVNTSINANNSDNESAVSTVNSSLEDNDKATISSSIRQNTSISKDAVVVNKPLQVAEPVVQKVTRSNLSAQSKKTSQQKVKTTTTMTKSDLPKIIYTTHIYATQPSDRFVMLNGRAYSEGDKTQEGFLIKEILENDLLIVYKGQEFTLPSLEDVNAND